MIKPVNRRSVLVLGASAIAAPYIIRKSSMPAFARAPMLGGERPNHYRFKFGKFEITTINDGALYLGGPFPIYGEDQFEEDMSDLVKASHLPDDRFEIGFSPVVINTGNELVLFDTGNGETRRPGSGKLVKALKLAGYSPEQIDVVVLTHFHADHIGGMVEAGKPTFANARYVTGETEYDFWLHPDQASGDTARTAKRATSNVKPFAEKITFMKQGSEVVSGITAMEFFGHTPGHMCYHIESEGKRIFLGADFCNHYVASLQRPDWQVSLDMQKQEAAVSRRKVLEMLAAEKIPFTSYHMPFPSVGYVETTQEGFVYVPVSYQLNL